MYGLLLPENLFNSWAECFHEDETALSLLKDNGVYLHIQSTRTRATDSGSIDKEHIVSSSGETELGKIFKRNDRIKKVLRDRSLPPLDRVTDLILEGELDASHFGTGMLKLLRQYTDNNAKSIAMVFKQNGEIQTIDQYKDADIGAIRRARGGMIQATIHKIPEYENCQYFIMPIKNSNNDARFVYKAFVNKSIMQNILRKNMINT